MSQSLTPGGRVQRFFRINHGEGQRVAIMMLYSALGNGATMLVGFAVANALFLNELQAGVLPYQIIVPAVAIVLALLVYSRVAARVARAKLVAGSMLLMIAGLIGFRLLLDTPYGENFVVRALVLGGLFVWIMILE